MTGQSLRLSVPRTSITIRVKQSVPLALYLRSVWGLPLKTGLSLDYMEGILRWSGEELKEENEEEGSKRSATSKMYGMM